MRAIRPESTRVDPTEYVGASMVYWHLLIGSVGVINRAAASLLFAAYLQGWLNGIIPAKFFEFILVMAHFFLYGLRLSPDRKRPSCHRRS